MSVNKETGKFQVWAQIYSETFAYVSGKHLPRKYSYNLSQANKIHVETTEVVDHVLEANMLNIQLNMDHVTKSQFIKSTDLFIAYHM